MPMPQLEAIHQVIKAAIAFRQLKLKRATTPMIWKTDTQTIVFQFSRPALEASNSITFCTNIKPLSADYDRWQFSADF